VFENRVMRICGPRRENVVGCWRRPHNKVLHNLYALQNIIWVVKSRRISWMGCIEPNIIRVIKSRRTRWMGYVACMGEMGNEYNILVGKPEGKRPLGSLSVDGSILEWVLGK
jgi:hypothetical protein